MITYTNEDCMVGMARYPDKYFDLAIVDPPYGIGENGNKNKSRGKLAIAKDYKPFAGYDIEPPNEQYFQELMRVSKIKLCLAQITLSADCRLIHRVGLFGIR